ncbi:hypothetical protein NDA13_004182 [Ustilago tritici]|nr:hypothetical protein NDA13_004182 [Ustilago tritici]
MWNPLSLHSGLGFLLFLSLVPVALSLPVSGGNGWPPYDSQSYGFQNHGFQSQTPNQGPPSSLRRVVTQQGSNVPQHGLSQQHLGDFGNVPQHGLSQQHLWDFGNVPQHGLSQQHLWDFGNVPQHGLSQQHLWDFGNVPQHGLSQQHLWDFGNVPQLAQNPPGISSTSRPLSGAEMDRIILDSVLNDISGKVPLISPSLPSSHAGRYPSSSEARGFPESRPSYNYAVELRQNAEGALQRQNEPDVPPHSSAVPAMHSRVSNEGASSSGTSYKQTKQIRYRYKTPEEVKKYTKLMQRRPEPEALRKIQYSASPFELEHSSMGGKDRFTTFHKVKNLELFQEINEKIFGGKLTRVETSELPYHTWQNYVRKAHLPSRELPFVTFHPHELKNGQGVIKRVRMTVHKGPEERRQKGPQEHQAASVGSDLKDKTLYNFWGIPESRRPGSQKTILHYGTGYIEPSNFDAVNQYLGARTREAVAAAHLH